jgi:molybdopterin synthase sulfur carrier subunit
VRSIRLFATLRLLAGARELQVDAPEHGTARDLVAAIARAHPELGEKLIDEHGELSGRVHVFVGGRNLQWLQGLDTPIAPDDEIVLFPPVAGG